MNIDKLSNSLHEAIGDELPHLDKLVEYKLVARLLGVITRANIDEIADNATKDPAPTADEEVAPPTEPADETDVTTEPDVTDNCCPTSGPSSGPSTHPGEGPGEPRHSSAGNPCGVPPDNDGKGNEPPSYGSSAAMFTVKDVEVTTVRIGEITFSEF